MDIHECRWNPLIKLRIWRSHVRIVPSAPYSIARPRLGFAAMADKSALANNEKGLLFY